MLKKLRWNLTIWYIGLSAILYVVLSAAAVFIFYSQLNFVILENLRAQTREIRPAIDLTGPNPTLVKWAKNAESRQIKMMYTVQLYNPQGVLLEEYGPPGIKHLGNGLIEGYCENKIIKLHSRPRKLELKGHLYGYLQVQESTSYRDEAIKELLTTLSLIAPFLLLALGFCGYLFAGHAIKPTENALSMLKHFTTDAAHELNGPIALIQATIETIEKQYPIPGLNNLLQNIQRATGQLKDMGQKLFALAAAETNERSLPFEQIDPSNLTQSIIHEFTESFAKKNIDLISQNISRKKIFVQVEPLTIIVNNLLENALKYTNPGGSVTLSLEDLGKYIQLTVEDTGIGIVQENLSLIFERFYRVNKHHQKETPGAGLGLAIVKAIVQAQSGNIKVESTIGKGSKFIITLPVLYEQSHKIAN